MYLCDCCSAENYSLLGSATHVLMYPRALLANVSYLDEIGVKPRTLSRTAEGRLVHTRRAGADNYAAETVLTDSILDDILTGLGAHILIIGRENNSRLIFKHFGDLMYIDGGRDIGAAVTNEYSDFLHI